MPGGRGSITDVAIALNVEDSKVDEVVEMLRMWIGGGYRITSSVTDLGVAAEVCSNPKALAAVWCYAVEQDAVDVRSY